MVGGYGDCPWSSTGRRTADPSVKMIAMTNGKVVDGRVELDEPIADGTRVAVVPIEDEEFFDLDEQLEAELPTAEEETLLDRLPISVYGGG